MVDTANKNLFASPKGFGGTRPSAKNTSTRVWIHTCALGGGGEDLPPSKRTTHAGSPDRVHMPITAAMDSRTYRIVSLRFTCLMAVLVAAAVGCEGADSTSTPGPSPTPGTFEPDSASNVDASTSDSSAPDSKVIDSGSEDSGIVYSCGAFSEQPDWTVAPGFHAVVVAKDHGLNQPVAITFASGAFGGKLYVVNQGDKVLRSVDTLTGDVASFTEGDAWGPRAPVDLTSITWDEENIFDGALYVGDEGSTSDQDSTIYRVTPAGTGSTFTTAPGPGLDDVFSLAFAPRGSSYPQGLFVTGDTDGTLVDWGVFDANGMGSPYSEVAGAEGIAFANVPELGGTLFASRPNGGGYAGDNEISRINTDGTKGTPITSDLPGIHAVTYSRGGTFGQDLYAASWQDGTLLRIRASGERTVLASGLTLTNYDGNIIAVSPDGRNLMVADRGANRIVCIEAAP